MYIQLVKQLVLNSTVNKEWSAILELGAHDALQASIVLFRLTGTSPEFKVTLQESNRRENFRSITGATDAMQAEGFELGAKRSGLATRYVRLLFEYVGSGSTLAIASVGVNLSKQS